MAKKLYKGPKIWGLDDGGDIVIPIGPSQGTSGEDSQFTWDPRIDENDINMFWASYDETDLAEIAGEDLYVSYDEFYAWLDSIGGW